MTYTRVHGKFDTNIRTTTQPTTTMTMTNTKRWLCRKIEEEEKIKYIGGNVVRVFESMCVFAVIENESWYINKRSLLFVSLVREIKCGWASVYLICYLHGLDEFSNAFNITSLRYAKIFWYFMKTDILSVGNSALI